MDNQSKLDALRAEMLERNICPDLAAQATQLVMGSGNVNARIVLIGEAPGKSEDETGLPFVGASGKFLDVMLAAAGMRREDVYITNVVKYRPPNNRDPRADEIAAFWPYLLRQLQIIEPEIVLTLGRFSMRCFLPGAEIGELHGQVVNYSDNDVHFTLAPLYHPAAALYNGAMRQVLIDDFVQVARVINN